MESDYLPVLLLCVSIVVAYILSAVELVIKSQDDPTQESFKHTKHQGRLNFIHRQRELFKLGIMITKNILRLIIAYTTLIVVKEQTTDLVGVELTFAIAIIVTATIFVLFLYLLPNVTFHKLHKATVGWLYYPTVIIMWIMYPFSRFTLILRNTTYSGQLYNGEKPISIEELSDAVEIVSKVNTIEEKRILSGMVRFANAAVEDIMCHRTEMVMLEYDANFKEVKELFRESGFSRIPVYKENSDNIVGVIHLKDVIHVIESDDYKWQEDIHQPLFANNELAVNKLLLVFQSKKEHMAIVADEYGSTLGLVTLEDVLEEIVGEINDEFDEEEENAPRELQEGIYIVEGKIPVTEFIELLSLDDELTQNLSEEIDTLAGLVVELLQDFPKVGSSVIFENSVRLTVITMNRYRIDRVRVERVISEDDDN